MKITINVKRVGVAAGSVGWLASVLTDENTVISCEHGKLGNPMVVLRGYRSRASDDLMLRSEVLASQQADGIETYGESFYHKPTLLGVRLTAKAHERVKLLADLAGEVLEEWMTEGDEEPANFVFAREGGEDD